MRVIVTGAGGFVGRALVRALEARGDVVVALDNALGGLGGIEGDLCEASILARAFAGGCDAVVHLATVPGGAAEADPAAAWRVNVEGSRALAEAAAASGACPRFVFASSIAVLGGALQANGVDDTTPAAPELLYGGHKLLIEDWLVLLTRRGALNALAVRLPGIVARPPGSVAMRSAFMSDVFHTLSAGRPFVSPVSAAARFWVQSLDQVVANLIHALDIDATGTLNLPALHVTMGDLVAAIAADATVTYQPDALLEAQFGSYPPLATPRADALGFTHDNDVRQLVARVLRQIKEQPR